MKHYNLKQSACNDYLNWNKKSNYLFAWWMIALSSWSTNFNIYIHFNIQYTILCNIYTRIFKLRKKKIKKYQIETV